MAKVLILLELGLYNLFIVIKMEGMNKKKIWKIKDASYSVGGGYCGKDASGASSILLCKVIVGDYTKGTNGTKNIPLKGDGTEYETLVNTTSNPSIFVVWRDYHAVPAYLVKYKG